MSDSRNALSSDEDDLSTIRNRSRTTSDVLTDSDGSASDVEASFPQRSYAARMVEVLSDGDRSEDEVGLEDLDGNQEDDGLFLYSDRDAGPALGYHAQLKDVLENEDSENELQDQSLNSGVSDDVPEDKCSVLELSSPVPKSPPSEQSYNTIPIHRNFREQMRETSPFIDPSVSRLRSILPGREHTILSRIHGASEKTASDSLMSHTQISPASRSSSSSNFMSEFHHKTTNGRESFKWTSLRSIGDHFFNNTPAKSSAVLESYFQGTPTVLCANGLVCIGTDKGHVHVFDFKQRLVCTCSGMDPVKQFGSVTALALSHDHTFIAVGHVWGHIQLFDIRRPDDPARTVMPTSLAAIASGRQEGHILGSRIVALGFISGRHTAFVSADDQGLAFYHSLGKVFFMEANDCLRLLGRYPEKDLVTLPVQPATRTNSLDSTVSHANNGAVIPYTLNNARRAGAILAMAPLPLGTAICTTDSYHLIAILTPIKLVIVGLMPTAKTWFRRHRSGSNLDDGHSRWRGCLAWFPSLSNEDFGKSSENKHKKSSGRKHVQVTLPMLAYSWGAVLQILEVFESRSSQKLFNDRTGKTEKLEVGKINFTGQRTHTSRSDILSIQWLNASQLIIFTDYALEVLDARSMAIIEAVPYDTPNIVAMALLHTDSGSAAHEDIIRDIQHSVRVYKNKIFILENEAVVVGTLLTWADRILSYVERGDFLSAIKLARDYYLGRAEGNKNGLPEDPEALRRIVGEKMSDLMVASAHYAFSEDRMTDSTHVTADNRGVDRTSLFEDLVSTCAHACIALDDCDFLFEDLFQYYDDSGILSIYLRQLEPFILDNSIRYIPPRITQRLVDIYDAAGKAEAAECLIWHIDPTCLDINQSLKLCHKYHLYDALIYIYNTALGDYITPVVELLGLVRKIQQGRRESMLGLTSHASNMPDDQRLEFHAYRIFAYLSSILGGLTYPSDVPLSIEEAQKAQTDVYSFVFYGRSLVWPPGDDGKLILTADEEGGVEPTYPYARLLLQFDAEAFLHTLDLAFEQSYLNDEVHGTSRQTISKILLDIIATSRSSLSTSDVTFVNIFIARNVPKYPQFIHIAPSSLQQLLVGLASDDSRNTVEDRQLAAEYLLSTYAPQDSDGILSLFEKARFFRILRSWYRQERQWSHLLRTYFNDTSLEPVAVLDGVEKTLSDAFEESKGVLPVEVTLTLMDSLSALLRSNTSRTALLVDEYAPTMHQRVIESIGEQNDFACLSYLRCLLGPSDSVNGDTHESREGGPSPKVVPALRNMYLKLLCRLRPMDVIAGIAYLPRGVADIHEFSIVCEEARAYDAVIWLLDQTNTMDSLSRLETFSHSLTVQLLEEMLQLDGKATDLYPSGPLDKLEALYQMGIRICQGRSQQTPEPNVPLEDLWFKLLSSQIDAVQSVSATVCSGGEFFASDVEKQVLDSLRSHIQNAFTSLVAVSSRKAVSFPRLFKRLVDATAQSRHAGVPYAEFRSILTSMLDSYRSEGELLVMGRRIIDSDFFDMLEVLMKERNRGWQAVISRCTKCKRPLQPLGGSKDVKDNAPPVAKQSLVVTRSGTFHSACYSRESYTHAV